MQFCYSSESKSYLECISFGHRGDYKENIDFIIRFITTKATAADAFGKLVLCQIIIAHDEALN